MRAEYVSEGSSKERYAEEVRESTQSDQIMSNVDKLNAQLQDVLSRLNGTRDRLLGSRAEVATDRGPTPVPNGVLAQIADGIGNAQRVAAMIDTLASELQHQA